MACLLAGMDTVVRQEAQDRPSAVSDVLEGARGLFPVIGVSTANGAGQSLADYTAAMQLWSPAAAAARGSVLEYWRDHKA